MHEGGYGECRDVVQASDKDSLALVLAAHVPCLLNMRYKGLACFVVDRVVGVQVITERLVTCVTKVSTKNMLCAPLISHSYSCLLVLLIVLMYPHLHTP